MAPGTVSFELGAAQWTHDADTQQQEDTYTAGEMLLRAGVADHAEVQLGWSGLGFVRTRDRAMRTVSHRTAAGDLTLALRRNLSHPDGSGLSAALMPFATLPVGRTPIGAGDWSAGVLVPLTYAVSENWSLTTTSEVDAAVDEDGSGRHLAFSEVVGAEAKLTSTLTATAEYAIEVDREPGERHLEHISGLSLAWQPTDGLQLDLGANLGLNHHADDAEVYVGVSRRF
jgi:hypothetical protein